MDTIAQYVTHTKSMNQEPDHGRDYYIQRAARHQQEAERLYRLGDDRQAAMHASISRKHADKVKEMDGGHSGP